MLGAGVRPDAAVQGDRVLHPAQERAVAVRVDEDLWALPHTHRPGRLLQRQGTTVQEARPVTL